MIAFSAMRKSNSFSLYLSRFIHSNCQCWYCKRKRFSSLRSDLCPFVDNKCDWTATKWGSTQLNCEQRRIETQWANLQFCIDLHWCIRKWFRWLNRWHLRVVWILCLIPVLVLENKQWTRVWQTFWELRGVG